MIENITNLQKIKVDKETLLKLNEVYSKIIKDEKKSREIMEKTLKEFIE